ncbi:MAG: bacteriohemerythrin, partial [Clostridiales bacterium]|nr:bacteriohemerythrin [Clostridiales bacterium]
MSFKWKNEYNCNVSDIDEQHQKLFEIGSRIYYMASLNDGIDHYDEIIAVLEELK